MSEFEELTELQQKILAMMTQFPDLTDELIAEQVINPKTGKNVSRGYVGKVRKMQKEFEVPAAEYEIPEFEVEKELEIPPPPVEEEPEEEVPEEEFLPSIEEEEPVEEEEEEFVIPPPEEKVLEITTEQIGTLFALPFEFFATRSGIEEVSLTTKEKQRLGKAWKPIFDQLAPEWFLISFVGINAVVVTADIGLRKVRIYRAKKPPAKEKPPDEEKPTPPTTTVDGGIAKVLRERRG